MEAENSILLDLNAQHEEHILALKKEAEDAQAKMSEMRHAFKTLQEGREKELREVSLVYFAKKKELYEKYSALRENFKSYRADTEKELKLKDAIEAKLRTQMGEYEREIGVAKLILRDRNLSKVVNERFEEVIDLENDHQFLTGGTFMDDLMAKFQFSQNCFQFINNKPDVKKPFNKQGLTIKGVGEVGERRNAFGSIDEGRNARSSLLT